ncbi:Hypothetical protein PHPALM_14475 [Phytophthora palmivora]|uniref:Uncharacterized protein n=1 Tax=Phytophthora palmivora TaxID=4796 RepID=A0A2P4XUQ8_9STRA|nr:Hypothetical protein PHPALM_14475 [Phytophthora palmivora]
MPLKRALQETQPGRKRKERRNNDTRLASVLDFHGVRRELKAAGWTSKLPCGLDNRSRYVFLGCSGDGQNGQDYLLGEEAVLLYFVQHCG